MLFMRMYLKRVTLVVVGALATVLILLMQISTTSYGTNENQSVNHQRILIHSETDNERRISLSDTDNELGVSFIEPQNDVNKFQLDNENLPHKLTANGRRKLNGKPPSHEELPPIVVKKNVDNNNVDSVAKSDTKANDDDVFGKHLGTVRTIKDPDIVSLNRIPFNLYPSDNGCPNASTLGTFWYQKYRKNWPRDDSWERFYAQIGTCDLYRNNSLFVDELLREISTMPIKYVTNLDSGTQVKFIITFENDKKALFKPMRFGRSFETHPDQFYFTDFERHTSEIAAFHLDRLLGFRRAIPTVGRTVNMSKELWDNADKALARTFFWSPAKNLCFVGKCDYYCDTTHAICGHPDMVEGSFQVFLPDDEEVPRDHIRSPYKRTYSKRTQQAIWQKDSTFCDWKVKYTPPYSNGRALLDLIDLYILDFLMVNQDRHHYETFTVYDHSVYFLHLDNGRAFGKTKEDDMDILAPLTQCCMIRPSTLSNLLKFYLGPISLSEALRASLSKDPVEPVLADKQYPAIDRRLEIILKEVHKCIQKSGGDYKKVIANSFYNPDAPLSVHESEEEDE